MVESVRAKLREDGGELRYPIRVASRRTGLSQDLIRAWERRYKAVEPERTPTGRRLYTARDLGRLDLLRRAVDSGSHIGDVARLSELDLKRLIEEETGLALPMSGCPVDVTGPRQAARIVENCLEVLRSMDGLALEKELQEAVVAHSLPVLLEQILGPFLQQIGEQWQCGGLRIAQEHLACQIVQPLLGKLSRRSGTAKGGPAVVVAAPAGQRHGLGVGLAGAAAAAEGWRIVDLGADLPPEELAAAVVQTEARALALSIVYPLDDLNLGPQLYDLSQLLPRNVAVFAGGRAAAAYSSALDRAGIIFSPSLSHFRQRLQSLS